MEEQKSIILSNYHTIFFGADDKTLVCRDPNGWLSWHEIAGFRCYCLTLMELLLSTSSTNAT